MKNSNDSGNVIIYPDFEKLKTEVEKLRVELSMLVLEKDELIFVECKNIEMEYMMTIGGLEYKAYEIESAILRLKRKIELIQAKKNRQEKIVLPKIEDILNVEFAEYQSKLNEQIEKVNAAFNRNNSKALSDEESNELKKLYRNIVKALHPDLHPDLSNEKKQLFYNALMAYENGNINGIRIIDAMVSEPVLPDIKTNALTWLTKEKERLSKMIKITRENIEQIKSQYPYTMISLVSSDEKIAARKVELEELISNRREVLGTYEANISEMMR